MENTDYKMIKQLEAAKNKVNEAYDIKNDFLKNMSHEIRTPLNGIVGLAEDIKTYKEIIPNKMDEDATELIYYSGLLVDTISSIIDINKLDNKFIDINENNYDIRSIVTQIKKTLSPKFASTTNFNINIDDNIPILYGDESHIRHIITKLLESSLETTTNGNIDLDIGIDDNPENPILKIVVKDEGIGIHEEILPYVCEYNNENIKNNKYYNAKLSLNMSIVKKLVEMLKGSMNIVSNYGQGTTVIIELPQHPGRRSK
jgi:signal transduction histidine kinase